MSAPDTDVDLAREFRNALPTAVRHRLYDTGRVAVLVHRAVLTHGWTVQALAAECSRDLAGTRNAGAVVTFRLEHCADGPPPDRHAPRAVPFCSPECAERRGFIEDERGNPIGRCSCRTAS